MPPNKAKPESKQVRVQPETGGTALESADFVNLDHENALVIYSIAKMLKNPGVVILQLTKQ
jgi:hypothetical protein